MNNIFKVKENKRLLREQYKLNLDTPEWNQVTFFGKTFESIYTPKFGIFFIFISKHLKI